MGWSYREYISKTENGSFCDELLSRNDFEAISATFCCDEYGPNPSEAVQKITADKQNYHKAFVIILFISVEKVSYHDLSDIAKKASEVAQKMEQ